MFLFQIVRLLNILMFNSFACTKVCEYKHSKLQVNLVNFAINQQFTLNRFFNLNLNLITTLLLISFIIKL